MLLAESEKYGDAINAIKTDIVYMPIELKKTWGRKIILWIKQKSHFYNR